MSSAQGIVVWAIVVAAILLFNSFYQAVRRKWEQKQFRSIRDEGIRDMIRSDPKLDEVAAGYRSREANKATPWSHEPEVLSKREHLLTKPRP